MKSIESDAVVKISQFSQDVSLATSDGTTTQTGERSLQYQWQNLNIISSGSLLVQGPFLYKFCTMLKNQF